MMLNVDLMYNLQLHSCVSQSKTCGFPLCWERSVCVLYVHYRSILYDVHWAQPFETLCRTDKIVEKAQNCGGYVVAFLYIIFVNTKLNIYTAACTCHHFAITHERFFSYFLLAQISLLVISVLRIKGSENIFTSNIIFGNGLWREHS